MKCEIDEQKRATLSLIRCKNQPSRVRTLDVINRAIAHSNLRHWRYDTTCDQQTDK